MADSYKCDGCSSRTQRLLSQRYSFPKKLLVAICLSVLIAMCLTPTEAASLGHNQRQLSMAETKDTERLSRSVKEIEQPSEAQLRHRRRHQRHQPKLTKDEEHMNKIIRNLKLTLNDFREHKYNVNDSEIYRNPKIKIPTTNFLEIRRFLQGLKNKTATPRMLEHKFVYIAVRLYKSLFKHREIFKALQKVYVVPHDVLFSGYQARRSVFLNEIVRNLNYILPVIGDGLTDFKKNISLTDPLGEKEKQLLENFKLEIEGIDKAETCLKYDGTIFKGYGLILNRWYCVVSSKSDRKHKENVRCKTMEAKMRNPKKHRKQKKKRRNNNI